MTNLFEIYIIELPKCKNNKTESKELDKWIKFLKNPEKLGEKDMSKEIKEAKECLEKISGNEEEIRWAELRQKYILEINTAKAEGWEEGKEEGFEVGRAEGLKTGKTAGLEAGKIEGRKEGRKEGEKEAKTTIAKNMLKLKIDIETISKATGLTKEEIQKLHENI